MATYSQSEREMWVTTPFGDDALLLTGLSGREEISRLFHFKLEMLSERNDLKPDQIIGKSITCGLKLPGGDVTRYFNGVVTRFSSFGKGDRLSLFNAEIVPVFWLLTQRADCRIFQNMSVPDIVKKVLAGVDAAFELSGTYQPLEYCVQYRETDFNFASRLLEKEGIYYFFKHSEKGHTLVMADSTKSYTAAADNKVSFAANLSQPEITDNITAWEHRHELCPGRHVHREHRFELPNFDLEFDTDTVVQSPLAKQLEIYDYPGGYMTVADVQKTLDTGRRLSDVHMQELETPNDVVLGAGKCRTFCPGFTFKVDKHHVAAEEGSGYMITSVSHEARLTGSYLTGGTVVSMDYKNDFTCIPDATLFRPARITARSLVHGAQTAVVVGPQGEDIYTDKYGRVKVQFHWDRLGKKDAASSCWIRVAQTWAGRKWGTVFLPRIGQEVVVDFLEGDPDRPLITGGVYNADQMPPYELPAHKTISTIKSQSSPNGDGFNEVRFEDKKGEEQIFIHGEKNQDVRIKNDCFEWIGNDRHLVIKNNQFEHVEVDRNQIVDRDDQENIGRDRATTIKGKEAKSVTGSQSLHVEGDVARVFGADASEVVTGNAFYKAKQIVINAQDNITLQVGQSFIVLAKDGISIGTSGTFDVKSSMPATIHSDLKVAVDGGATVAITGPMVQVQGSAMVQVQGGMVLINS